MKILAISDHFIRTEYYEACFAKYPQYELKTIMFGSEDRFEMRDIFHTIERKGPDAYPLPQEIYDEIEDADVLMVHICPVPSSLIARGKKLRAILANRGGLENIALETANARGIPVLNNPAHNSNGVCELAMGLIITEIRNIARSHIGLKQGIWRENYNNTGNIWELRGKTVGIVGFGNIGHLMAEKLCAFGCHVLVNDIHYREDDEIFTRLTITKTDLPSLMRQSDIVTLHARNENVILNAELLAMMKPSAFFINTARAHMVDYGALYELLRDRKIMGAALDVHPVEPIPDNYPFLGLDNVTLTTHRAGDTLNAYSDSPEMLVVDYTRYLEGQKPRFFVNPQVGYGK